MQVIVDNACMQLVMNPHRAMSSSTTNLFGDILSDLCAGLVGGLGLARGPTSVPMQPSSKRSTVRPPDIAGKNIANPCALLLTPQTCLITWAWWTRARAFVLLSALFWKTPVTK